MSAQTKYGFSTPIGVAGGIYDIAPYAIDTFLNSEETGALKPGLGVVAGTKAGVEIAIPTSASAALEGVVTNNRTTEFDMDGKMRMVKGASVGVMRYGRIYVRVAAGVEPAYGDAAYVVATGEEAGFFTTASSGTIAVKARFLGAAKDGIALVELFNQAQK